MRYLKPELLATTATVLLCACNPTVTLEAPEKPVQIDLNIKIDHEVRVKLEKDVDNLVKSRPEIF